MRMKNAATTMLPALLCALLLATGAGATVYEFNGHYYEPVLVPEGVTWSEAVDVATRCNGYLATITSQAEDEFVYSLIDEPAYWWQTYGGPWLGGTDFGHEGTWTWVTGESWTYTNWWPSGQPDNAGGTEHYLQYHGGPLNVGDPYGYLGQRRWNDVSGDLPLRGYVIEWSDSALPNEQSTWGGVKSLFR